MPLVGRDRRGYLPELVALAGICCVGIALRVAFPDCLAVEHFDEGVYASNWFCRPPGLPELIFPRQYLYAPPLWPEVCRYTLFFAGGRPQAVMWGNVVVGSLMIPLIWLVARNWLGPAAGLTAAALCAVSDTHVALSRMALTDVGLALFLTAGVWTGGRAIQTGRPRWILLAGLCAALAWWTKYNGWLTLAITGAGLGGWLLLARPAGTAPGPLCLRWLATAAVAAVLWSPVLWDLQAVGGYGEVASNHARYFVGLAGWWDAGLQQLAKQRYLDSGLGVALAAVSLLACAAKGIAQSRQSSLGASPTTCLWLAAPIAFVPLAVCGGTVAALGLLALMGWTIGASVSRLQRGAPAGGDDVAALDGLPRWIGLAWILGLLVATPLYTPYPRLILPLLPALWIGAAYFIRLPLELLRDGMRTRNALWPGLYVAGGALMLVATGFRTDLPGLFPAAAWQDRTGLAQAAPQLVAATEQDFAASPAPGLQGVQAVLYVFAEPPLFYHLSSLQSKSRLGYWVQPVGDHLLLETGPPDRQVATYLVTGPHAEAVAADAEAIRAAEASGRLSLVVTVPYRASDLVLLDQPLTGARPEAPQGTVRLYRVR